MAALRTRLAGLCVLCGLALGPVGSAAGTEDLYGLLEALRSPRAADRAVAQERLRDRLLDPGALEEVLARVEEAAGRADEVGLRLEDCVAGSAALLPGLWRIAVGGGPRAAAARRLLRANVLRRVLEALPETTPPPGEREEEVFESGVVTGTAWPFADIMDLDLGLLVLCERFGCGPAVVVDPGAGALRPLDALDWIPGTPASLVTRWSEERGLLLRSEGAVAVLEPKSLQSPPERPFGVDPEGAAARIARLLLGPGDPRRKRILLAALLSDDDLAQVAGRAGPALPVPPFAPPDAPVRSLRSNDPWLRAATLWGLSRDAGRARALAERGLAMDDLGERWVRDLAWIDPPRLLPLLCAAEGSRLPAALARRVGAGGVDEPLSGAAAGAALEAWWRREGARGSRVSALGEVSSEGRVSAFGMRWVLDPAGRRALAVRREAARLHAASDFGAWEEALASFLAAARRGGGPEARSLSRTLALAALLDVTEGDSYRPARLRWMLTKRAENAPAARTLAAELFVLLTEEDVGRAVRWMEEPGLPWGAGFGAPGAGEGEGTHSGG